MQLADFILANIEPILDEWVGFARTITSEKDLVILRDHAAEILRATARDMGVPESDQQRAEKSEGEGDDGKESRVLDSASEDHAVERVDLGFDMTELLSEYRALRASVIRLWRESLHNPDGHDLDDLTRFSEAIDQSMAGAAHSFTERMDESREVFLAILGHDLRNPVAALKVAGDVLTRNESLDAKASKIARELTSTADQMEGMIHDLLDFALTRMGQSIRIVTAEMNLGKLCRSGVDEMKAAYPLRTIRCTSHGDVNGKWDSKRLWQVVSNLLSIAMRHGANDMPIVISVTGEAFDVVINVHNEGKPIPPERLPSLFRPVFRRPDQDTARRLASVGLGLYIVHEIVVAHAGTVHAKSSRKAGTDFTVHLPRQPAPQESKIVAPSR